MPQQLIRQITGGVIAIIILGIIGIGAGELAERTGAPRSTTNPTSTAQPANVDPISYTANGESTVLDQLKQNHQVETVDSSFGTFVRSIDGVEATGNSAWLYYVDGQLGEQPADQAKPEAGKPVEWRYETF